MGRAKGLSDRRIMYNYAARNAFLPNLSGFAMSLGFVIAGAILVEYVFNYPGLGYMLYNAVRNSDYPLMQVLFMLFTVAVLVALFVCDVAIAWLDPRARAKG
jgi:peptide/nickel transport system permease protein